MLLIILSIVLTLSLLANYMQFVSLFFHLSIFAESEEELEKFKDSTNNWFMKMTMNLVLWARRSYDVNTYAEELIKSYYGQNEKDEQLRA